MGGAPRSSSQRATVPFVLLSLIAGTLAISASPTRVGTAALDTSSRPFASAAAREDRDDAPAAHATFTNPVIDRDFPDPEVIRSGPLYYAYATNSGGSNVQVARSSDLVHWEQLPDALPTLPPWTRPGRTWAPAVSATADGFVLYFVAWHRASGRECIGVATSAIPGGPFAPATVPLVCPLDAGGAIDPAAFVDGDGTRYLLWKNDGNCCGITTRIYLQRMTDDGLALDGDPVALIAADRVWEGGIVEAPKLWLRDGIYHLFYSANGYGGAGYAIGHALAGSLFGPYLKDAVPFLASSVDIIGPGGQDIVVSGDGSTWLAYHAWDDSHRYRAMGLARLTWDGPQPLIRATREPQTAP